MLSFSFPVMEIHNSKDPIALMVYPSRKIKAFKLRPLSGKYFYIREGKAYKGIFELDPTKAYHFGKTPCYVFDSRNCLPMDAILVNELNNFSKTNNLTKIKRKDVDHAGRLREIASKVDLLDTAKRILNEQLLKRKETINKVVEEIGQPQDVEQEELGTILTNYLVSNDLITIEEKGELEHSLSIGKIDYNQLIGILKDRDTVRITAPIDLNTQTFLEDFGGYNPEQLANFTEYLTHIDKGLKSLTSVPVKSWMPASIIMALLIGGSIAFMVILNSAGDLGGMLGGLVPNP
jgi:hypothetical protein